MPEGPKHGVQGIHQCRFTMSVSVPCPTGAASQGAGGRPNLPGISSEYTRVQGELIWARCQPQVFGEVFQEIFRNHKKVGNKGNVKRSFNMSKLEHNIHPSLLLRSATRGAAFHLSCYVLFTIGFVFSFAFAVSPCKHPSFDICLYIHHDRDVYVLHTIYNTTYRKTCFLLHCTQTYIDYQTFHWLLTSRYVCMCCLVLLLWMVPAVLQGPKTPGKDWPVRPGVGRSIGLDEHAIEIKQDWKLLERS